MFALHNIASNGVNVVCTLHQPRQEIMELCHQLILLGPGGKMIYNGPAFDLRRHFSLLGYTPLLQQNVADYAMDVLAGFVLSDSGQKHTLQEVNKRLSDWWDERMRVRHLDYISRESQEVIKHITRMKRMRDRRGGRGEQANNEEQLMPLTYWETKFRNFRVGLSRQHKVWSDVMSF
jgi:ABC-type multidrug transport system ATPase subunit